MSTETFEERVKAVQALMDEKKVAMRGRPIQAEYGIVLPRLAWVDLTQERIRGNDAPEGTPGAPGTD